MPDTTGQQDGYYSQNAGNPPASAPLEQTASAKSSNETTQSGKYNFSNSSASSEAKNSGGGGSGGGGGGGGGGGYDIGASLSMASSDSKTRENNRSDDGTHVLTGSIFDHSMNFGPRTNSGAPVSTGGASMLPWIIGGGIALVALGAVAFLALRR